MLKPKLYSIVFVSPEDRKEFILKNFNKLSGREMARRLDMGSTRVSKILRENGIYADDYINGVKKSDIKKIMNDYSGKVTKVELMTIIKDRLDLNLSYSSIKLWGRRFGFKTINQKGKDAETRFFIDGNKDNLEVDNILMLPSNIGCHLLGRNLTGDSLMTMAKALELQRLTYDLLESWIAVNIETGAKVETKTLKELSEICGFACSNVHKNKRDFDRSVVTKGWIVSKQFGNIERIEEK
ncbi:hypothetical protein [Peptoniphilus vaginalis]|uniref:hypothetical protein n=1 Tax=Peptoniphilus vaginalis TaxID=1756987 RepID=UPI0023F7610C|nr:hypothetical protein [Peptoniphilus vaginalis]